MNEKPVEVKILYTVDVSKARSWYANMSYDKVNAIIEKVEARTIAQMKSFKFKDNAVFRYIVFLIALVMVVYLIKALFVDGGATDVVKTAGDVLTGGVMNSIAPTTITTTLG